MRVTALVLLSACGPHRRVGEAWEPVDRLGALLAGELPLWFGVEFLRTCGVRLDGPTWHELEGAGVRPAVFDLLAIGLGDPPLRRAPPAPLGDDPWTCDALRNTLDAEGPTVTGLQLNAWSASHPEEAAAALQTGWPGCLREELGDREVSELLLTHPFHETDGTAIEPEPELCGELRSSGLAGLARPGR